MVRHLRSYYAVMSKAATDQINHIQSDSVCSSESVLLFYCARLKTAICEQLKDPFKAEKYHKL